MVSIEILNDTDGSWKTFKEFPLKSLGKKECKFLCFGWEEEEMESINSAVAEAKQLQYPNGIRVISELVEMYCIFWQNGRWLHSATD